MDATQKKEEMQASQKTTFTRWVNLNLASVGQTVDDLFTAFVDGTKLITLLQILAKKKVGNVSSSAHF
jgi:hypothetical protein